VDDAAGAPSKLNLGGPEAGANAAFFLLNFLIAMAAAPLAEVTLPAISAAVATHTGHMGSTSHLQFFD
jgi:hypothetical protein